MWSLDLSPLTSKGIAEVESKRASAKGALSIGNPLLLTRNFWWMVKPPTVKPPYPVSWRADFRWANLWPHERVGWSSKAIRASTSARSKPSDKRPSCRHAFLRAALRVFLRPQAPARGARARTSRKGAAAKPLVSARFRLRG